VAHTDPARLALIALGEKAPDDEGHVRGCLRCQAELGQLNRVVAVVREAGEADRLETPPPGLWVRIAAAAIATQEDAAAGMASQAGRSGVDPGPDMGRPGGDPGLQHVRSAVDSAPDMARPDGSSGPQHVRLAGQSFPQPAAAPQRPWWRRPALAAAGLAAALAIAAGAWAGARALSRSPGSQSPPRPQAGVVARIALRPLPAFPQWRAANGTAIMAAGPAGQQLTVTLNAPDRAGFYEVWLLARDGHSMISLGDLGPGHHGTFTMPPGVDLGNYSRVDVSLQAFNGSTVHSPASVVRGSLPPA
jgi:Anti-sigma-K factor rskA